MRKHQINLEILRGLNELDGSLEREDSLLNRVRLGVQPVVLQSEFDEAIRTLDSQRLIIGLRGTLGGPVKWKLTDLGRVTLLDS